MIKKSRDEIVSSILRRFENNTQLVNTEPGSMVRTFSEVLSEEFSDLYSELDLVSTMGFVSTAEGRFLDFLGKILNCTRLKGEKDENFRARIVNQVYVVAGANQTSIRLKLLEIETVKDVILEEFTKGTGSFTAYIITDQADTPQTTLREASKVLEKNKAFGIRAEVKKPLLIYLNLKVRLMFEEGVSESVKVHTREMVKQELKHYVDNIKLGGTLTISECIKLAKNTTEMVKDVDIFEMKVDGVQRFVRNVGASRGERLFLENITIV